MIADADRFVRARHICDVLGICRRTLYQHVKRGEFPPADRPARRLGEPDLWKVSTVRTGIERYTNPGPNAPAPQSAAA